MKLHYEFTIKRNITIIKGNSGTGKTTLINMIRQFANLGISSGIDIVCDVPCRVLEGRDWPLMLQNISGNILFIDEENSFIRSEQFASAVRDSDNYFVIITRENLYNLPYSVEEIYGVYSSGKYQNTRRIYQQLYRVYSKTDKFPVLSERIIVEDTNSGYEFFKGVVEKTDIKCETAGGKIKLFSALSNAKKETCMIADGAAIGAEMEGGVSHDYVAGAGCLRGSATNTKENICQFYTPQKSNEKIEAFKELVVTRNEAKKHLLDNFDPDVELEAARREKY